MWHEWRYKIKEKLIFPFLIFLPQFFVCIIDFLFFSFFFRFFFFLPPFTQVTLLLHFFSFFFFVCNYIRINHTPILENNTILKIIYKNVKLKLTVFLIQLFLIWIHIRKMSKIFIDWQLLINGLSIADLQQTLLTLFVFDVISFNSAIGCSSLITYQLDINFNQVF